MDLFGWLDLFGSKIEYLKKSVKIFEEKMKRLPGSTWKTIWKVGREDPRRVIHSFKVGLPLTLVSLLYLIEPMFKGIGQNAIWAVMTVVVVLEFTAGATLCKGLNRGLGTLLSRIIGISDRVYCKRLWSSISSYIHWSCCVFHWNCININEMLSLHKEEL